MKRLSQDLQDRLIAANYPRRPVTNHAVLFKALYPDEGTPFDQIKDDPKRGPSIMEAIKQKASELALEYNKVSKEWKDQHQELEAERVEAMKALGKKSAAVPQDLSTVDKLVEVINALTGTDKERKEVILDMVQHGYTYENMHKRIKTMEDTTSDTKDNQALMQKYKEKKKQIGYLIYRNSELKRELNEFKSTKDELYEYLSD